MTRNMKLALGALSLTCAVMLTGGRTSAAQTTPEGVVRAFVTALNNGDYGTMRTLWDPATHALADPGTPFGFDQTIDQVIDFARQGGERWTLSSVTAGPADTVLVVASIASSKLPPLAHPYSGTATFTVTKGRISAFLFISSAQTRQDLAALAPPGSGPGMPATGAADLLGLLITLALGLVCLGSGARLHLQHRASR